MKATGIVRKVDELGRIVLPIELRRTLDIEIKDPLEIFVNDDCIILKKYTPAASTILPSVRYIHSFAFFIKIPS